eukprot:1375244-Pyramimonas_sp.AAC.1
MRWLDKVLTLSSTVAVSSPKGPYRCAVVGGERRFVRVVVLHECGGHAEDTSDADGGVLRVPQAAPCGAK